MTSPRILIAEIAAAHGIKGFVKLTYFGEDIRDTEDYNPFFTTESGANTLVLQVKNAIKGGYVAAIDGITDRTQAEALRGTRLYIERSKLKQPEENEYYHTDLVGCVVLENNIEIGKVIAVDDFGAGALLDIRPASGSSFYLPFKGDFVGTVDIAAKTIHVSIPDGLLEGR